MRNENTAGQKPLVTAVASMWSVQAQMSPAIRHRLKNGDGASANGQSAAAITNTLAEMLPETGNGPHGTGAAGQPPSAQGASCVLGCHCHSHCRHDDSLPFLLSCPMLVALCAIHRCSWPKRSLLILAAWIVLDLNPARSGESHSGRCWGARE